MASLTSLRRRRNSNVPSSATIRNHPGQRQNMEGYLAHKLTANLDSGHPYKNNPPTV